MTVSDSIEGRHILVVEDDFLIGHDFAAALGDLGVNVLGPVGSVDDALDLLEETTDIDWAVLDLNLGGELSYPIADALAERGLPFVFTTGYDKAALAARYSEVIRCEKPVVISEVVQALLK